jgi:hypothetical protein
MTERNESSLMPELVKIPFSEAFYVGRYARPDVGFFFARRQKVFEGILDAWIPAGLKLANVEANFGPANVGEHKITFKLPERRITLQFGPDEYTFRKEGSSWETAEVDALLWEQAEAAILDDSEIVIASGQATVAMHLEPTTKQREEILAAFVPDRLQGIATDRQANAFGSHLRFPDGEILIDFSVVVPNGIYVRFSSFFKGRQPMKAVLEKLHADEHSYFALLGVAEDKQEQTHERFPNHDN